jgi:hypothetical protein
MFTFSLFVWRMAFACLVVCRWQVRHGRTSRVLGGRAIERSCGAMCGLHYAHEDEKRGFLG